MSTPATLSSNYDLNSVALSGGIPTKSQDFAASIVFAAAYIVLAIAVLARLVLPASRHKLLIRPLIFLILQAAASVMRAIISHGNYSTGLFIADQVCALAGFVLVCEPVVAMFQQAVSLHGPSLSEESSGLLTRVSRIARIGLIVALILGIVAASLISQTSSDDDNSDTIKSLREANAALIIVAVGGAVAATGFLVAKGSMLLKHALPLVFSGAFILVAAGYKLDTAINPTDPLKDGTKVAFYTLLDLPQWLAAVPFAAFNIKQIFFPPSYEETSKFGNALESGRPSAPAAGYGNRPAHNAIPMQNQRLGQKYEADNSPAAGPSYGGYQA